MGKKTNTNDPSPEEIAAIAERKAEVDAERERRRREEQIQREEDTAAQYYYGSFRLDRPVYRLNLPEGGE